MPLGSKALASSMAYFLWRCAIASETASPMALASSWRRSVMAASTAAWTWGARCCESRASRSWARRPSTCSITRRNTSRASSLCSPWGSSTRSVSMGTVPGSLPVPEARRSSASALPSTSFSPSTFASPSAFHVVHVDIVAALLVERIALARPLLVGLVGGDDLQPAIEGREEGRPLVAQVEQHLVVRERLAVRGKEHGRLGRERRIHAAMRHEARRLPGPEVAVEVGERLRIRRPHDQLRRLRAGLRGETAGEAHLVLGVAVEVDSRHALARLARKCDRSATGRPVAPFSAPDFHAVPAMSRCAHGYALVKRARKQAAVTEPPARVPMLGKSAKLLFSMSW